MYHINPLKLIHWLREEKKRNLLHVPGFPLIKMYTGTTIILHIHIWIDAKYHPTLPWIIAIKADDILRTRRKLLILGVNVYANVVWYPPKMVYGISSGICLKLEQPHPALRAYVFWYICGCDFSLKWKYVISGNKCKSVIKLDSPVNIGSNVTGYWI